MTTSAAPLRTPGARHPAVATALRVATEVEEVLGLDPAFMPTADKEAALLAWAEVASLVEVERLRLLAVSGEVADAHGARDAGAWLAHTTRIDQADGRRDLKVASALSGRWHSLDDAFSQAQVNPAQARVIAQALDALPAGVEAEVLSKAEAWLIDQARQFAPRQLRALGRKVLDVVAPEVFEAAELKALEAEEARARTLMRLTTQRLGDGTTIVRTRISDAAADRLTTYLHAYTSPANERAAGAGTDPDPAPYAVRMGRAFEAFLEDVDPRRMPLHGGNASSVVVLVDEAVLRAGVGVATTTTGQQMSIGQVRRLACSAGILPAVLGGTSEVLDAGRRRRLFTYSQRVALAVRDGAAAQWAATSRRGCARPITLTRGDPAAAPTWTAASCSAPTITIGSTIRITRTPSPSSVGSSSRGSTGGREAEDRARRAVGTAAPPAHSTSRSTPRIAEGTLLSMDKSRKAAKNVSDESNPVRFVKKLRGLPVVKQVLRVFDRFL